MNLALSISVTILLFIRSIVDVFRGKYIFAVLFLIETISYIFYVIPIAKKNDDYSQKLKEKDEEYKKVMKEVEKIINKED